MSKLSLRIYCVKYSRILTKWAGTSLSYCVSNASINLFNLSKSAAVGRVCIPTFKYS